jgi:hypothetical protein
MTEEEIRTTLDGDCMPVDFWLYRLQEVLGFDHPACAAAEELRPLVAHLEERGFKMPRAMPRPDLRNLRDQIQRIKQCSARGWKLRSEEDKRACRRMHRMSDELCDLTDSEAFAIEEWFDLAAALMPPESLSISELEKLRERVEELRLLGVYFRPLPAPRKTSLRYHLDVIYSAASAAFSEPDCESLVKCAHHQIRNLHDAMRAERII